jgi:phosphoribosylanthranilate isomerase
MIRDIVDKCGLALAQIHGDETAEFCESLGRPVIRGIRLRDRNTFLAMAECKGRAGVRGFVLDAFFQDSYGGTGKKADWDLAKEAAQSFSFFLAGGLTPNNVQEAIQKVRPYGVDVSSGVESAVGKKDPAKIQAFVQAVKLVSP